MDESLGNRFFETSPDLLFIASRDGSLRATNPSLARALGESAEALVGSALRDRVHVEDRADYDAVMTALRSGTPGHAELRLSRDGAEPRWVRVSCHPDSADGTIFGTIRDLTEQRTSRQQAEDRIAEMEARAEQLGMLSKMGELLQSSRDMNDAREVIDLFLKRIFPDHSGAVYVLQEGQGMGEVLAAFGEERVATVINPRDCWALRRGRPHWSVGEFLALDCGHARTRNLAHVCLPLMAQGMAKGLLHLELPYSHDVPRDSAEARFVNAVADHLGLAIANVSLRERLQTQSIRDPLTGCFNRRYLEETLVRELRRADRERIPLSVVLLDLDHFKSFNDNFGHIAADEVLVELGAMLRQAFRTEDVVCRFGGEEFVVVLPGASTEQTLARVTELRDRVHELPAGVKVGRSVTFSAGVASFPDHAAEAPALLRLADAAMYQAKTGGRDRACVTPTGPLKAVAATDEEAIDKAS